MVLLEPLPHIRAVVVRKPGHRSNDIVDTDPLRRLCSLTDALQGRTADFEKTFHGSGVAAGGRGRDMVERAHGLFA